MGGAGCAPPGSGHPPCVPPRRPGSDGEGPAHPMKELREPRGGDEVVSGGSRAVQQVTMAPQGLEVGGGFLEGVAFRQSLERLW